MCLNKINGSYYLVHFIFCFLRNIKHFSKNIYFYPNHYCHICKSEEDQGNLNGGKVEGTKK